MADTHAAVNHLSSSHTHNQRNGTLDVPKIVSMKLFASWEIDKTSSSCIPRLCMFSITGLQIYPSLFDEEVRNVILAVQMAGSRRVLRSGEIPLNREMNETPLDISFSMQYAHFLKRDDNNLRIAIQRRKKYKNRAFLGYKTLAGGIINLSEVLQRSKDLDLDLYSTLSKKDKISAVVTLQNITSKPVSYDDGKTMSLSGVDRSPESDDEDDDLIDEELSADDSSSDDETPTNREQTNFKQKIARLLRRFRSSDDAEKHILTVLEREQSSSGAGAAADNLDDLFDELESLSDDSENEHDNISIRSIRRPTLPQYFDSSETTSLDTMKRHSRTESERGVYPADVRPYSSFSTDPLHHPPPESSQFVFDKDDVFGGLDTAFPIVDYSGIESAHFTAQLTKVFKDSSHSLPEALYIVDERVDNSYYTVAHMIYQCINSNAGGSAIRLADKEEFSELLKQVSIAIQSFTNNNSRALPAITLVLLGNDSFYNRILDGFTSVFSEKSPDWLSYVKFVPIPLGKSNLSKQLSRADPLYQQLFSNDGGWKRLNDKALQRSFVTGECTELLERIYKYKSAATSLLHYPVSEAMIARFSSTETQEFIPFLTEVLIGTVASPLSTGSICIPTQGSSDGEESAVLSTSPSTFKDPVLSTSYTEKQAGSIAASSSHTTSSPPGSGGTEPCELQLEYWVPNRGGDKAKAPLTKETLKGFFKYIQVIREKNSFRLIAMTREKRAKMIRLGKKSKDKSKEKEVDSRSLNINRDGITRIICTAKDSSEHLLVNIDDQEHHKVHFFQLSTQWQTHVKHLPIAVSKQYQSYD